MTQKIIPQAELASLLKSSTAEVLTAVKACPQSNRWDAIDINRRSEWMSAIEQNMDMAVEMVKSGELHLTAKKSGCSLNDANLSVDSAFIKKNVSLDRKAEILFRDMAGLLVVATASSNQRQQTIPNKKHLRIA